MTILRGDRQERSMRLRELAERDEKRDREPLVIGVVGGVASGKSLVSKELERLGAVIVNADQLGHRALEDPTVQSRLRARWGAAIFDAEGRIDRSAVAQRVFPPGREAELDYLESVTHPKIKEYLLRQLDELRRDGVHRPIVLDAALLFEAGWDRNCTAILFVDAPEADRMARAAQRGWSSEDFRARESSQLPLDEKRRRANWIVDNSGTPEELFLQVRSIWRTHIVPGDV